MTFLKYIFGFSFFVFGFLFITINLSVPPALSAQINVKTMSSTKLNTYTNKYTSDNGPRGGAWGRGSSSGK